VKILDFGLATCAEARPGPLAERGSRPSIQTEPGRVLGTPPYMSPEQTRGEPTDHRSDVFSFGCVLYEMVTGQPAFQGKSAISIASAILNAEPKPVRGLAPETPRLVARIVERCLSKDVERRYESMAELGVMLDEIANRRSLARRFPRGCRPSFDHAGRSFTGQAGLVGWQFARVHGVVFDSRTIRDHSCSFILSIRTSIHMGTSSSIWIVAREGV
jgi:serine/threonine protein kinase